MAFLPTFPSLDFSNLDARGLANLDDKVTTLARDAAFVAIGFTVLGFQQLQVRRHELSKQASGMLSTAHGWATTAGRHVQGLVQSSL